MFHIDAQMGDALAQERAMRATLSRLQPSGSTPLAERLDNIRVRLLRESDGLAQRGQKVMLTIATDGIPNSRPALVQSMRRLMHELPVRITIRLCTNEADVVDFYNDLDRDVEMPLDIIDDFHGEAIEVGRYNPWVVYTPTMHIIREAGTFTGILDYLDERRLTPMEVAFLSSLLMQVEGQPAYPRDAEEFLSAIEHDIEEAAPIFDVRRRAFAPPLDLHRLQAALLPQQYAGLAGVMRGVGLGGLVDWYFQPMDSESWECPCSARTVSSINLEQHSDRSMCRIPQRRGPFRPGRLPCA
jgi:hypothetical protein